jgi:hypothetical protein
MPVTYRRRGSHTSILLYFTAQQAVCSGIGFGTRLRGSKESPTLSRPGPSFVSVPYSVLGPEAVRINTDHIYADGQRLASAPVTIRARSAAVCDRHASLLQFTQTGQVHPVAWGAACTASRLWHPGARGSSYRRRQPVAVGPAKETAQTGAGRKTARPRPKMTERGRGGSTVALARPDPG